MDARRIVQLWSKKPEGGNRIGSGYLLTDSVVLTAAHAVCNTNSIDDNQQLDSKSILVQSHASPGQTHPAHSLHFIGHDIAILVLLEPFKHALGPDPRLGTLGSSTKILPAKTLGFPLLGMRTRLNGTGADAVPEQGAFLYREQRQFDGEISCGTGYGDGTISMRLDRRHFTLAKGKEWNPAMFTGLSGGPIFVGEHLVGIVTQDLSPGNPTLLLGLRISLVEDKLTRRLLENLEIPKQAVELLGLKMEDISSASGARDVRDAHLWQAQTILDNIDGGKLLGRGNEMLQMSCACSDLNSQYLVWIADQWSGKSALMATFVTEPPAGIDVISFFINSQNADARTASHYLASLISQLEAYLRLPSEPARVSLPSVAEGHCRNLLIKAAAAATSEQRRLVLVVDALDEDEAFLPGTTSDRSIAKILPQGVPDLLTIVATRPYEHVLTAMPAYHPFRLARPHYLTASPFASDIRDEAVQAIRKIALGTDAASHSILGFLCIANHSLTPNELTALHAHLPDVSPVTPAVIRNRIQTVLHRIVRKQNIGNNSITSSTDEESYELSHSTLPKIIEKEFGPNLLADNTRALLDWAKICYRLGWSDAMPRYFEIGYPNFLSLNGESKKLFKFAMDRKRHYWLFTRRGGNEQALDEIARAAELLQEATPVDIGKITLLAFERDHLLQQYTNLPINLPKVWTILNELHRSEILALSMPLPMKDQALAGIVRVLAQGCYFKKAEYFANLITRTNPHDHALADIAYYLALSGSTGKSKHFADLMTSLSLQDKVLEQIARSLASVGKTGKAKYFTNLITDPDLKDQALSRTALIVIQAGKPAKAQHFAALISSHSLQAETLSDSARLLALDGNFTKAEQFTNLISDTNKRSKTLEEIAKYLFKSGNTTDFDHFINLIENSLERDRIYSYIVRSLIASGNISEAKQFLGIIIDTSTLDALLAGIACDLADDNKLAEASLFATYKPSTNWQDGMKLTVANKLTTRGNYDGAKYFINLISDPQLKHAGRLRIAQFMAQHNNTKGAQLSNFTPYDQALLLSRHAMARFAISDSRGAKSLIADAKRTAELITDTDLQTQAFMAIARVLLSAASANEAKPLITEAESLAARIVDGGIQNRLIAAIALTMAKAGSFNKARRIADGIENPQAQAQVLAGISLSMAEAGHITKAKHVAKSIQNPQAQAQVFADIAESLANVGQNAKARGFAIEAERMSTLTVNPFQQALAMADIAQVLDETGYTNESKRVFSATEHLISMINDTTLHDRALVSITRSLARANNITMAQYFSDLITKSAFRDQALSNIAQILARSKETAEAKNLTNLITSKSFEGLALSDIAYSLILAGNNNDAKSFLLEAELLSTSITATNDLAQLKAGLARSFAKMGNAPKAKYLFANAEALIPLISERPQRSQAMGVVARYLAQSGDIAGAKQMTMRITSAVPRGQALADIASCLACDGRITEAENLTDLISDPYQREKSLADIAYHLAQVGYAEEAQSITDRMSNLSQRVRAMIEIAKCLTQLNNFTEAKRFISKAGILGIQNLQKFDLSDAIHIIICTTKLNGRLTDKVSWIDSNFVNKLLSEVFSTLGPQRVVPEEFQ